MLSGHALECRHAVAWRARLLGAYLVVHLLTLMPWAAELFSSAGMIPDGSASPILHAFPNLLALHDGPVFVSLFVASGALTAALLWSTAHRRGAALACLFVLACLFGRNPLIRNPSLPYVGLALVAVAATRGTRIPRDVMRVLWILLAAGYGYAGLTKLSAPSWVDGTALDHLVTNPLARGHADLVLALPPWLRAMATWGTLGLEIAFPLLVLSRRLRPLAWLAMTLLHVSLLVLIDFADLTLGMLVIHAFTFDERWLAPVRKGPAASTHAASALPWARWTRTSSGTRS